MLMSTGQMYGNNPAPSPLADPITYIGNNNSVYSSGVGTWASVPIATTDASDIVLVGLVRESSFGSTSTNVTVNGTVCTLWGPGALLAVGAAAGYIEFWRCKPGALATANIVSNASALANACNLFVWVLRGQSNTPVDEVASSAVTATTIALNDIATAVGGAVVAIGICSPPATGYTESWTGGDAVVEDADVTDGSGNYRIVACHIAPTSATTTDDLTLTLASSKLNIGGAISFGP
ncbi:hypothetical protein LB557_24700 [Mesorhizobium sp. BR115XR7A]|uniref:hypothetical protein n=1 Tax=Mesorhizobium sp. BR115XR7A TaxID=2876645 RepID=UPI001CCA41AB|nr:hypothetical protein [Mesorhizobium sp. BR115XR7A]MBZ9909214.1 hypothetical protein [Mesorhizobium sp. BR115XR7A]MBZ9933456.1 hypothetical protein [Mesorhizobium sp. BR1-1-5]